MIEQLFKVLVLGSRSLLFLGVVLWGLGGTANVLVSAFVAAL